MRDQLSWVLKFHKFLSLYRSFTRSGLSESTGIGYWRQYRVPCRTWTWRISRFLLRTRRTMLIGPYIAMWCLQGVSSTNKRATHAIGEDILAKSTSSIWNRWNVSPSQMELNVGTFMEKDVIYIVLMCFILWFVACTLSHSSEKLVVCRVGTGR